MINSIIIKAKAALKRAQKNAKKGQTLVEYALILAFISVVAILVLKQLGSKVTSVFSNVSGQLDQASSGGS
jgi:Flp pilus assembly pilin Flp